MSKPKPIRVEEVFGMKPEEVIQYFRSKGYRISWNWYDTWKRQHFKNFTVAHCSKMDILQDIRNALDSILAEGKTLQDFKDGLGDTLRAKGWWGQKTEVNPKTGKMETYQAGSPARLETIYDTNLRTAYAAGNYTYDWANADNMPYWMYSAVMDSNTRPEHAALDGKVFRADDPLWDKYYPPNDWGCRCTTVPLDEEQVKAMGLRAESSAEPSEALKTALDDAEPPEEWAFNPGNIDWEPDLSGYDSDLANLFQDAGTKRGK